MKLLLFSASLAAGGAERVTSRLANAWCEQGHSVTLVTLAGQDADFFSLVPGVRRIGLNAQADSGGLLAALIANFARVRGLRRVLSATSPDCVVSFGDCANVVALLASRGQGARVVVSERTDPSRHFIGRPWRWLRRVTYPWADGLVVQTRAVEAWMRREIPGAKVSVIPNPVQVPQGSRLNNPKPTTARRVMAAMGRLSPEKGFDLLLAAFAEIAPRYCDWDLVIIGDGKQRTALQAQTEALGVAMRVTFVGQVANPEDVLRTADLFVLSSRYEGFPNALLEAMAAGLPVVSFDCPSGPSEIITQGQDGVLVPAEDSSALAAALDQLMASPAKRRQMGAAAARSVARFGLEAVLLQWQPLIEG